MLSLLRVHCFALTLYQLVGGTATASSTAKAGELLMAFKHQPLVRNASSYYLAAGMDWHPGDVPQITVLMAEQPLSVRIALTGSETALQSVWLLYKCSSADAKFSEELLEAAMQRRSYCSSLRPFTIERISALLYRLVLTQENEVPFEHALRHSLEVRYRLIFYQGQLESASLFVFNFDALTKMPQQKGVAGKTIYLSSSGKNKTIPDLTTPELETFMNETTNRIQSVLKPGQRRIKALRHELTEVIRQAHPMVRALLSLTLYFSLNCNSLSERQLVLVSSGGVILASRTTYGPNSYFLFDLTTGDLHGTESNSMMLLAIRTKTEFQFFNFCLKVSVVGDLWPYNLVFQIPELPYSYDWRRFTNLIINLTSLFTGKCHLASNPSVTQMALHLPAHLYEISLPCPMICSDLSRFFFQFIGSLCDNGDSSSSAERPLCSRLFATSPTSCKIDFLGPTSPMHNGDYRISAGGVEFTYLVTVVSLPIPKPDLVSNQTRLFNPESGPVTLSCPIEHSGIGLVDVSPGFRLEERFVATARWISAKPHEFNDKALYGGPNDVGVTMNRSNFVTEARVWIARKNANSWWQSWKVAFECFVSTSQADAQRFGLPEYKMRPSWNLVAIRKERIEPNRSGTEKQLLYFGTLLVALANTFVRIFQ